MTELTKEDIALLFEVVLLNYEKKPLYEMLNENLTPKHIRIGRDILDLLNEKW
jgi:hypothetical protein